MNQEVNVLALVKGKERYVFLYNAQNRVETLDSFARYASDPELSFNWHDAAVLTQKVLREERRAEIAAARRESRKNRAEQPKKFANSNVFEDLLED